MNLENILLKTKCPPTIVNVFRQLLYSKNIYRFYLQETNRRDQTTWMIVWAAFDMKLLQKYLLLIVRRLVRMKW